jgi:hypothetical protein
MLCGRCCLLIPATMSGIRRLLMAHEMEGPIAEAAQGQDVP